MAWGDRQAELIDGLELALVDRCALADLSNRDIQDLLAAVRRAGPPARDLRLEQTMWIQQYFVRFAPPAVGDRAAVRLLQLEIGRYERSAWRADRREPGPPVSIRGTPLEFFWEILDRGALPSERSLRKFFVETRR